jgi:hypothetical protein
VSAKFKIKAHNEPALFHSEANMSALVKRLVISLVLLTPLSQFAQRSTASTIDIGGVDIAWWTRPEAVVTLLNEYDRYEIAPVEERTWKLGGNIPKSKACIYVGDKESERHAYTLHFDKKNRLVTVEKNWTPAQGSAVDFAAALYSLVAHRKWGYCMLIPEHDFESEGHGNIINVACDDGGIKISVAQAASPEGKSQVANIYEWVHAPVKKTPGR